MDKKTRFIVNLHNCECFTSCNFEDVDKEIIRAKDFYQKDVERYKQLLEEAPNMSELWSRELETCQNILASGFEAVTWEEYYKLQQEKWLDKEPTEITMEEYDYAMNVLPPKNWISNERYSMFFIGERTTMTFYGQYLYAKTTGKYYYAMADICDKSTWLDKMLNL